MASVESSLVLYLNEAKLVSGIACKRPKEKKRRNSSLALFPLAEQVPTPKPEANYGFDDMSEAMGR